MVFIKENHLLPPLKLLVLILGFHPLLPWRAPPDLYMLLRLFSIKLFSRSARLPSGVPFTWVSRFYQLDVQVLSDAGFGCEVLQVALPKF